MSPVSVFRLSVWAAIAVLGVFLIASTQLIGSPIAELSTGTAKVGGPFALTSHKGERVDNRSLAGKPYLVFFGFTYCPEICPTTLFELTDLMAELGPEADTLKALFITVDPERDTQEALAGYMTSFDDRIVAVVRGELGNDGLLDDDIAQLHGSFSPCPLWCRLPRMRLL